MRFSVDDLRDREEGDEQDSEVTTAAKAANLPERRKRMNSKKTAVTKAPAENLPAKKEDVLGLVSAEQTTGFENVKPQDTAIPFLGLLQALSPQVKKGHAQRIEGAAEGMFYNNVTQEVCEGPLRVIPCAFQKAYVEWVPRDSGGGFVMQHPDEAILETCSRDEKNNHVLPNGHHVVPTAYHFVLIRKADGLLERAVVSMSKTQLKKSRRWLSQMMNLQVRLPNGKIINPPMFSHSYEVGAELEQKDANSWYGFTVGEPILLESAEIYAAAKKFHDEVTTGSVNVRPPEDAETEAANVSSDAEVI